MVIDYSDEAVAAFTAQCDEFIGSKLIMSNQKIRMLLKCLAYYETLRNVVSECRYNFDYEAEYSRAIVNLGTATVFRLPQTPRKKVALVVCLLLDFDESRMDIVNFIRDFYREDDRNDSYVGFINGIIAPFKAAMLELLATGEKDETEIRDDRKTKVNAAIAEQTEYYIKTQIEAVQESKLSEERRRDLVFMLDNLVTVMNMRDARIIKAYWIGLKNLIEDGKLYGKNAESLDKVIREYLRT